MKTDSLIVPQSTLMDVLTMIEEGDSGNAHDLLKAVIELCPLCNRAEAEAAGELLNILAHVIYNPESPKDPEYMRQIKVAIAKARGEEC